MNVNAKWVENTTSILSNGRGHQITIDLPPDRMGDDVGPTPSELMHMSIAGSLCTIFSMLALKRDLIIGEMNCEVDSVNRFGEPVPERLVGKLNVQTEDFEEANIIWEMTQKMCTTLKIFMQANIKLELSLVLSRNNDSLDIGIDT